MSFGSLLSRHSKHAPDSHAVISHHQNVSLTYSQLDERSTSLAVAFSAYGVCRGDTVAIMLGSRTEYLEVSTLPILHNTRQLNP